MNYQEKMLKELEIAYNSGNFREAREINHQLYEIEFEVYQKLIGLPRLTELANSATNGLIESSLKHLEESLEKGIELAKLESRSKQK